MPIAAARHAFQRVATIGASVVAHRLDARALGVSSGRPNNCEWLSIQLTMSVSARGGRVNRLDFSALAR